MSDSETNDTLSMSSSETNDTLSEAMEYQSTDPNANLSDSNSETLAELYHTNESIPLLDQASDTNTNPQNVSQIHVAPPKFVFEENADRRHSLTDDDLEPSEDQIVEKFPENKDFVVIGPDVDLCTNLVKCMEKITIKSQDQQVRNVIGMSETVQPNEVRLHLYETAAQTCTFIMLLITEQYESNGFYKLIKKEFIEQALRENSWKIVPVSTVEDWNIYGLNGIKDVKLITFLRGKRLAEAENLEKIDLDSKIVQELEKMFATKSYLFEERQRKRKQNIQKYLLEERQKRKEQKYRVGRRIEDIQTLQVEAVHAVRSAVQRNNDFSSDSRLDTTPSHSQACSPAVTNTVTNTVSPQIPATLNNQSSSPAGQGNVAGAAGAPTKIIAPMVLFQAGHINIQSQGPNMTAITDTCERGQQQMLTRQPLQHIEMARPMAPPDSEETTPKQLEFSPTRDPRFPQQLTEQYFTGVAETGTTEGGNQVPQAQEQRERREGMPPYTGAYDDSVCLDAEDERKITEFQQNRSK